MTSSPSWSTKNRRAFSRSGTTRSTWSNPVSSTRAEGAGMERGGLPASVRMRGRVRCAGGDGAGALREPSALAQLVEDEIRRLFGRVVERVDNDLGVLGRLVGVVHARHLLDLAAPGPLVEALDVPLLADLDRGRDVDLDEGADLLARPLARRAVGRDQRDDRDDAVPREDLGHERDPPGVRLPRLEVEPEVAADPGADLVSAEQLDVPAERFQLRRERLGDRRLSRARQSGQPDAESVVGHGVA